MTLNDAESKDIKTKFFTELSKTCTNSHTAYWYPLYWYPLQEVRPEIDVIAFEANFLENSEYLICIRDIFAGRKIDRVCVIPELNNVYYSDSFLEDILGEDEYGYTFPYYSEQYTFDISHEWLIYKSHEFTVTFAGKWLVQELKKHIRNYQKGMILSMKERRRSI